MTVWEILGILAAGIAAGTINTIVGSGSLVTFPTLLAFGYPPVVANVSNSVGLVFGGVSGVIGYRRELAGQRRRIISMAVVSALGGVSGGLLLLKLPESAFNAIVPVLILLGVVLVIVQPKLNSWMAARRSENHDHVVAMLGATFCCAIYGGYFGAAQGVIMMGVLGTLLHDHIQRLNAAKNVSTTIVNFSAAVLFVFVADVAWIAAGLIAVGSIIGGQLGAKVGRRLPPIALRIVIVVVGLAAVAKLLLD